MNRYRVLSIRAVWAIHGTIAAIAAACAVTRLYPLAIAAVAGELAAFAILRGRAGRIVQRMADAAALVEAGDYPRAAAVLDDLADRARLIPNLHALIAQRRLDVHFALGELDAARATGHAIIASGWFARPSSALYTAYPQLCATLAVIAALRDDATGAAAWRARAATSVTDPRKGALVFVDAVLAARAERFTDLGGIELAVARRPYGPVLRWVLAYASAHTSAADEPAAAAKAAARTAAARPQIAEVLALAPWWPELAAFVAGSR